MLVNVSVSTEVEVGSKFVVKVEMVILEVVVSVTAGEAMKQEHALDILEAGYVASSVGRFGSRPLLNAPSVIVVV